MKTTRNNTQKTENTNVKRMTVRAAVVVFSLIIISLTSTSAQELWEQLFNNSSYGKMVELKGKEASEMKEAEAAVTVILEEADAKLNNSTEAFVVETESEPELNIESWMISNPNFNSNEAFFETDSEPALSIEPWMTNSSTFSSNIFAAEEEPELNVESWMLDNPNFSNTETMFAPESEAPLAIEPWMTDGNNFKTVSESTDGDMELNIESWMLENPYFQNTDEKPMQLEAWMTDNNLWSR